MGDPTRKGQDELRTQARERIRKELLPRVKPLRVWGGRGTGLACSLCDLPIRATEPEMELEFEGASEIPVRFHLQCQSIWDAARLTPDAPLWTPVEQQLPPLHVMVEARLSLGEARAIILNVMRVWDQATGAEVWLNANTNGPLPDNWRPLEWRNPGGAEVASAPSLEALPSRHA